MSKATPYYWREAAPYEKRGEARYELGKRLKEEEEVAMREVIDRHGITHMRKLVWATMCNGRLTLTAEATEAFPIYIVKKNDGSRWFYMPQSPEPSVHFIRIGDNIEERAYMLTTHFRADIMQQEDRREARLVAESTMERYKDKKAKTSAIYEATDGGLRIITDIYPEAVTALLAGGSFRIQEEEGSKTAWLEKKNGLWYLTRYRHDPETPLALYMRRHGIGTDEAIDELLKRYVAVAAPEAEEGGER